MSDEKLPSENAESRDIDWFAQRILDDGLDDGEKAELAQMLEDNADRCEQFALHFFLHSLLKQEGTKPLPNELLAELAADDQATDHQAAADISPSRGSHSVVPPLVSAGEGGLLSPEYGGASVSGHHSPGPIGGSEFLGTAFPGAARSWVSGGWFSLGFMALTILLGIAAAEGWLLLRGDAESNRVAKGGGGGNSDHYATPVAFLTQANGCAWGGGSPDIWTVGRSVQAGDEITLHEGIAEFRLSNGVSLSIEGPTALVMASPKSLVLQHGRLTAFVPWAMTDFKLITSACHVTACDAEFGVYATGGEVDIHAFSGEVYATPPFEERHVEVATQRREQNLASGADFSSAVISAGRGLALVNRGESIKVSRWHAADKGDFATQLTMGGALPITQKYVDSVKASKPIGYWRFESNEGGQIANEISDETALKVVGNLRLIGDSTNSVAELGRPGSDGFFLSQSTLRQSSLNDYSAEFWVKPSHAHTGGVLTMLAELTAENDDAFAFYLQMLGPKKDRSFSQKYPQAIRFLHRNPPGPDSSKGTSCFSSAPYTLRRWQHVAAVKNDEQMSLFVDGQLVASGRDLTPLAKDVHLLIGQGGVSYRINPFIGQLDELAIYDRALTAEEIQERLKLIDWQQEAKTTVRRKDI